MGYSVDDLLPEFVDTAIPADGLFPRGTTFGVGSAETCDRLLRFDDVAQNGPDVDEPPRDDAEPG